MDTESKGFTALAIRRDSKEGYWVIDSTTLVEALDKICSGCRDRTQQNNWARNLLGCSVVARSKIKMTV